MNLHSVLGLIAAIFAFGVPAHATSFAIQKFSTFINSAPFVVRGEIHNIYVENGIAVDGQKTIYTYATLELKEVLKGSLTNSEIKIRKAGGTTDGYSLEIPGSPEFVTGEDALLFLGQPQPDQSYEIESMELGKFGLEPMGDDFKITGGLLGYTMHSKDPHEKPSAEYLENSKPWTLSGLRAFINDGQNDELPKDNSPRPTTIDSPANAVDANLEEKARVDSNPDAHARELETGANRSADQLGFIIKACFATVFAVGIFFFFKRRG